jgi:hypothetical protein
MHRSAPVMFQEQRFSTELCVNDREHRLLKEVTKKWNGTSSTYSVLAITIADQNASTSKYCLSLHCNCGNFSHLWNECVSPASS